MSRLDWFWRRLIVTKLYTQGWGKPEDIKRIFHLRKKLGNRAVCQHLVPQDYPVYIDKETVDGNIRLVDGHFMSPLKELLPGIMPKETEIARFQMVLPTEWRTSLRPVCVQMGGTGDHGFRRRRKYIAKPLLQEEGIASLILENPFYGCRKPKNQFRSSLHRVSDLFVMGGCLILESLVLFNWLDRQGYGPLGASGISMGGHMASLGATNWHKPLSLIPCMSGSTAAGVFTHGVLSTAIPWKLLMEQYMKDASYQKEVKELIVSPEPYWKEQKSMYMEGRMYFHELEDKFGDSISPAKAEDEQFGQQTPDQHHSDSTFDLKTSSCLSSKLDIYQDTVVHSDTEKIYGELSGSENVHSSLETLDTMAALDTEQTVQRLHSANKSLNWLSAGHGKKMEATSKSSSWLVNLASSIPLLPSWFRSKSEWDDAKHQLELDCKHFMRGVMDECTHLGNFSVPVDPELIIIVLAENDEYVPTKGYLKLSEIWPGSQVRTLPRGHISGFLFGKKEFRKAIADSFNLHAAKYFNTELRHAS